MNSDGTRVITAQEKSPIGPYVKGGFLPQQHVVRNDVARIAPESPLHIQPQPIYDPDTHFVTRTGRNVPDPYLWAEREKRRVRYMKWGAGLGALVAAGYIFYLWWNNRASDEDEESDNE